MGNNRLWQNNGSDATSGKVCKGSLPDYRSESTGHWNDFFIYMHFATVGT